MKVLSISIAAYNVEKFLEQTLQSLCIEDIFEKIEVLIIDDGSKDKTEDIAIKYQNQYPNTFKYIKKENGGHGSTVNRGIEEATGRYFKIVDGDDWIDKNEFIKLVNYLEKSTVDLVLTDFSYVYDDGKTIEKKYFPDFIDGTVYSIDNVPDILNASMHCITVKTSILKENKIRLTEKCFYVDVEFDVYVLRYIESIVYKNFDVYMYRFGTPNQSVNVRNMVKNIKMREKISSGLAQYISEYEKNPCCDKKRYNLMKSKTLRMITGTYLVYLAFDDASEAKKELIAYEKKIKTISSDLYRDSGKEMKIKALRFANHAFFESMNWIYHKLKM